jgi:hypothetical protein
MSGVSSSILERLFCWFPSGILSPLDFVDVRCPGLVVKEFPEIREQRRLCGSSCTWLQNAFCFLDCFAHRVDVVTDQIFALCDTRGGLTEGIADSPLADAFKFGSQEIPTNFPPQVVFSRDRRFTVTVCIRSSRLHAFHPRRGSRTYFL